MTPDKKVRVGFAFCGSFCTFARVIDVLGDLARKGYGLLPIMSTASASTDTRFGKAGEFKRRIEDICGVPPICDIASAEPIGPKKLIDVLVVEPATGNTLAKLAAGIADGPVTLAVKSQLRNGRPVVIAVSTNDGLGVNAKSIGVLAARKNVFFVPFGQDDPAGKPCSLVADFSRTEEAVLAALEGRQLQPLLV
ncbi:MAG: dipicolinate synthase subunit B [Clostridia bacterium]|nr:dipicolinate synthase subunit B [Clostridia bacterium]